MGKLVDLHRLREMIGSAVDGLGRLIPNSVCLGGLGHLMR